MTQEVTVEQEYTAVLDGRSHKNAFLNRVAVRSQEERETGYGRRLNK